MKEMEKYATQITEHARPRALQGGRSWGVQNFQLRADDGRCSARGRARSGVAQICNLLYRRVALGRACCGSGDFEIFNGQQITNPQHSRLEICATPA